MLGKPPVMSYQEIARRKAAAAAAKAAAAARAAYLASPAYKASQLPPGGFWNTAIFAPQYSIDQQTYNALRAGKIIYNWQRYCTMSIIPHLGAHTTCHMMAARHWVNDVYARNPDITLAQINAIGGQLSAAAHSGGFFSGLTSSILDAAITLSGARVITPFAKKTVTEVVHASNKVVKGAITHTPGFHALPKDVQHVTLQLSQVPTNMHELEKSYQVLQRFYFSKAKYVDPIANQIYQHELRQDKIAVVQAALQAAEADYKIHPTAAKYAYIQQLMAELASLSAEEAHFMHNAAIFATVAAIALSVFTFGAGTPAASAAYVSFANMVGTASAQMISLAINTVLSAVKKVGTVSDQAYAQLAYTLGIMAKYPPPKSLTRPVDQMRWSLMAAANGNAPATATVQTKKDGSLFPLVSGGLTLLSVL